MGTKSKINSELTTELPTVEPIKSKRGRKSKKDLMASLNMASLVNVKASKSILNIDSNISNDKANVTTLDDENAINLNVLELNTTICDKKTYIYHNLDELNEDINEDAIENVNKDVNNLHTNTSINTNCEEPKLAKKRGRKPKGGKIIQQLSNDDTQKEEKTNVILHLKCSMKDLQTNTHNNDFMESYNFTNNANKLNYELVGNTVENNSLDNGYDCDDEYDTDSVCKDANKEIWKKLKQLEHNLHINNVNNKRSACFWDTCEFDNPPIYIPKHFINGTYHVYGCFCSPECGVAYLMNESIDSSTKFERYHLFNHIYTKIYDYKKNIKPSPNPYYMLEKYYGNLSIQEYRSLLRNERLFLIVDKPLTRILPELHEDNDDFILNNKLIPSNNYQIKSRLQRKKPNKNLILNEKFGAPNMPMILE
jgi:hypothetical protein